MQPKTKFRSGLESAFNDAVGTEDFLYEPYRIPYIIKKKYVPDFIDKRTGAMIECKGFFRVGDTQKYKAVRDEIDRPLIFVFTNSSKKLRKGSKMTLGQWCEKEGLAHFTMKSIDELLEHLKCLPSRK
tara:strand:+ start:139 stop:522 length:384 start_codon:yes stop_codon:yes gene_type:complete